ncbi:MAG: VWA domain-containing protein [Acidobacteriota bacterium]|nr:VWA domain-containing protein [Acidobacteriota bacterium]
MKKLILFFSLLAVNMTAVAKVRDGVQEEIKVKLVELDVKVTTLSGRPISGLTPSDLVITENGVTQTIDSFEEVRLTGMPAEQADQYRPRIMFLLDLQNTSYANMHRVFPQLRRFTEDMYLTNSEVGVAVNADGIHLVQPFTRSQSQLRTALDTAEEIYRSTYHRSTVPNSDFSFVRDRSTLVETPNFGRVGRRELSRSYMRNQLRIMGQFVHFLGAYDGNKSIILISDAWTLPTDLGTGETGNQDGVLSLKDIQTAGLYNKISINVISMSRPTVTAETSSPGPGRLGTDAIQSELAAITAGFSYSPNHQGVARVVNRIVNDSETYYRVRYYSKSNSKKFRRVRVRAKGMGRIAHSLGGYFPNAQQRITDVQANMNREKPGSYSLAMETDWMYWSLTGLRGRAAYYAIGQRAFDGSGNLVYEKVTPGSLKKKSRKEKEPLQMELGFKEAGKKGAVYYEVTVIDLNTGKRVIMKGDRKGDLI